MSAESIIRVEGVGKRYVLGRDVGSGTRYRTLREDVMATVQGIFRRPVTNAGRPPAEEFWALRDVSFEIARGEVVGVIGRNGAGKSTLLKILSRITEPTTGRITLKGRVASLLEVGTGFHPELTGRENIFLNGAILGMHRSEIRAKFDEIVAFAEVERFLDTPVKRYSSGMYVRLAFAVAAHLEPEILIVDEVLAVGDAEFQKKCLGKMENVAKGGRTVLFVSHNLGSLRQLCTAGICLRAGEVVSIGPIAQTIAYYTTMSAPVAELEDVYRRQGLTVRAVLFVVDGHETDAVSSGEDLEIRFQFARRPELSGQPLHVGFALENAAGAFVIINYSHFHRAAFQEDEGWFSATLRRLPVAAGTYKLHLRVLAGEREVYWNTAVRLLVVSSGDFYGTGVPGEEALCPWLQTVEWKGAHAN